MIKKINEYPAEVLRVKAVPCVPVDAPGELLSAVMHEEATPVYWPEEIIALVQDLKDTAESLGEECAGLASNQIWDKPTPPPSVFIVRLDLPITEEDIKTSTRRYTWVEFINPIIKTSGRTLKMEESCFSRPGFKTKTKREANVTIAFNSVSSKDRNSVKLFAKDTFAAIAVQHEFDHLLGKLI